MDFFFSDDPPGSSRTEKGSGSESDPEASGAWSFGGLIRSLTVKSESVIETYRRDLQEFGTGLKKEIEVAQGSVGQAFDEIVIKGTAQIISQGKEAILADDLEPDSNIISQNQSFNSKRYSRFDAQARAIRGDVSTYCEEPDDLSDYRKWRSGFDLEDKNEELEGLFEENRAMEGIYKRVVPASVDHETFWCRYLYKVHKLKQAEDLRVKLVNRAILTEEEELSWDVDDSEDEKDKNNLVLVPNESSEMGKNPSGDVVKDGEKSQVDCQNMKERSIDEETKKVDSDHGSKESGEMGKKSSDDVVEDDGKSSLSGDPSKPKDLVGKDLDQIAKNDNGPEKGKDVANGGNMSKDETVHSTKSSVNKDEVEQKPDEKKATALEAKSDHGRESFKGSDALEEDLGWDEIEDLSNIDDDNKRTPATKIGSPNRADLRKRLSTAEEEEDLSWDIEDDD